MNQARPRFQNGVIMRYNVEHTDHGSFKINLRGAPPNVVALPMAPVGREAQLNVGAWLVMSVGVWNGYDRIQIDNLLDISYRLPRPFHIGIRLFDDPQELTTWLKPESIIEPTPLWSLISEGNLIAEESGSLAPDDLLAFVGKYFPKYIVDSRQGTISLLR